MKIIFAGSPVFACPPLEALIQAKYDIVMVLTQPDKPKGRGRQKMSSAVNELAKSMGLPVMCPTRLDATCIEQLKTLEADVLITAAYGKIIPQALLDIPQKGCLNIHASVLPFWRGAAPVAYSILSNQGQGLSIMRMDAGMDTGDIIMTDSIGNIDHHTTQSLLDLLSKRAGPMIVDVLKQWPDLPCTPQDHDQATYAPKISKPMANINWHWHASEIERFVRAFNPWPVAQTHLADQILRIWHVEALDQIHDAKPGSILSLNKYGMDIACQHGICRIQMAQESGKRKQCIKDIWHDLKIRYPVGHCLSSDPKPWLLT